MKNKQRAMGILVLSIMILVLIAIPLKNYTARLIYKVNNYLPNNLYVDTLSLGGKTIDQAKKELDHLVRLNLNKTISVLYTSDNGQNQSNNFTREQLGFNVDKTPIINHINAMMNKDTSILKRLINYRNIEKHGLEMDLSFNIHYDTYLKALEVFDSSKLKPPVDAKYSVSKGTIQMIQEENGYAFDKEGLYQYLLANKNLETVNLKVKYVKPAITIAQLETQGIKELVSSFTTKFDAGNVPRASNIKLAASIIEGTILPPGGTFSFNEVVGKRTIEKGFREAGVYINGKVDTGIGGGICQVSTTLYNAVLLSDLEVLERSNHSLTVPYVPLSRDAAVSWGSQDLKFNNNTQNYIYIHSITNGGSITFELYSTKTNKRVELISTTLSRNKAPIQYIDDIAAFIGKEKVVDKGHDGYQSQLVKIVYVDEKKISSEVVSRDKYLPETKIVKRGIRIPDVYLDFEDEI
ncbi:MAG: hypothetical protein K0Q99_1669 [Clostridia bacterium]|nr:hypothetical protein [Clostridia bacterium]